MTEHAKTELSPDLRRLAGDQDWYGCLTLENLDLVAARLRKLLGGRRYTWAATVHWKGAQDDFVMPEVRTGMWAKDLKVSRSTLDDGREMGHITVSDSYGVWGISTTVPDGPAASALSYDGQRTQTSYLHFKQDRWTDQLQIEHFSGSGNRICWVAAVEMSEED